METARTMHATLQDALDQLLLHRAFEGIPSCKWNWLRVG
jgi:hypothetical protein